MSLQNLKIAAEMAAVAAAAAAAAGQKPKSAWNQLDQLLTCAICLDRYRNPKLLPCQHTFCMEPCLEGLIDYVRRQIKCPECRAEHRIPYQGIQGYPTNVTLMRFLELHFEVTGELPDTSPTTVERCTVCTERSYLGFCAHCEKKVCSQCKESHMDIMKREISRINNQVRRGLHRLQDALGQTDKSAQQLQTNCRAVVEEIDQVYTRLQKELKDRQEMLKTEVQTFVQGEVRSAQQLKENLEIEVSNVESNCDLIEKHVTETPSAEWEDVELMEYKETFLKTLEFLRNFDPDQADFSRRIRFQLAADPEAVHNHLSVVGELIITAPNFPGSCVSNTLSVHQHSMSQAPGSTGTSGLMRSKSEHRLATSASSAAAAAAASSAHQRHESYLSVAQRMTGSGAGGGGHSSDTEAREGRTSPLSSRRRTGDLSRAMDHHSLHASSSASRRSADHDDVAERPSSYASRRYGSGRTTADDDSPVSASYRSRYGHDSSSSSLRDSGEFESTSRSVRFARHHQQQTQQLDVGAGIEVIRERVFETEDATRGPMSGIARLMDVPRVMQKLQQHEQRAKQPKVAPLPPPPVVVQQQQQPPPPPPVVRRATRQVSEEDEIAKQKAQNKVTSTTTTTQLPVSSSTADSTAPSAQTAATAAALGSEGVAANRPLARRVAALQREESMSSHEHGQAQDIQEEVNVRRAAAAATRKSSESDSKSSSATVSRQSSLNADNSTSTSLSKDRQSELDVEGVARRRRMMAKNSSASTTKVSSESSSDDSDSDSDDDDDDDSEAKTPTPQSLKENAKEKKPKEQQQESSVSQDKPNYFRYRMATAAPTYSRTPSNGSLNSQDDEAPTTIAGAAQRSAATSATRSRSNAAAAGIGIGARGSASGANAADVESSGTKGGPMMNSSARTAVNKTYSLDRKDSSDAGTGAAAKTTTTTTTKPRFVSRFLTKSKSREIVSSSSSSSSSSSGDGDSEPEDTVRRAAKTGVAQKDDPSSPIGALLARSAIARRDNTNSGSGGRPTSGYQHHRDYKKDIDDVGGGGCGGGGGVVNSEGIRYSSLANKYLASLQREREQDIIESQEFDRLARSNKYLSKSKSSASISFDDAPAADVGGDLVTGSLSSRRSSLNKAKDLRQCPSSRYVMPASSSSSVVSTARRQLGRSKSSHELLHGGGDDDPPDDDDLLPAHYNYSGGGGVGSSVAARRGSARYLRETSPIVDDDDNNNGGHEDSSGSSISSWARYLKNKYGYKGLSKDTPSSSSVSASASALALASASAIGRSRSSHALASYNPREANFEGDPGNNLSGGSTCLHDSTRSQSTVSHYVGYAGPTNSGVAGQSGPGPVVAGGGVGVGLVNRNGGDVDPKGTDGSAGRGGGGGGGVSTSNSSNNPGRSAYLLKRRVQLKIGVRGSEPACFTWPRGIAVGPDDVIVVADSSNHRVQLFDERGVFRKEFGSYGSAEGEFDCLAGVAVNRIGQYIVSDRYNHRLQVFDPSGRFLRAFGSQGSLDGKLSYPWGVATDSLGFIYVCDKENHRVQVFQSDGTFVGKFGSLGSKPGQLEHPHYVAVSSTNRVVVSDSNNHRVQIFDVNGKVLTAFGGEGSEPGQFKFPRGVAVDEQGYVVVGDSGNNRVQIFAPDGQFLRAFGTWGSGDGDDAEFKGLEGVAVNSKGEILVCDRENHRIQIF